MMHCEHCKDKKDDDKWKVQETRKNQDNQSTYSNYKTKNATLIKTMLPIKRIWIEVFGRYPLLLIPFKLSPITYIWFYESAGYETEAANNFHKIMGKRKLQVFVKITPTYHICIYIWSNTQSDSNTRPHTGLETFSCTDNHNNYFLGFFFPQNE